MLRQLETRGRFWCAGILSALLCFGTVAQAQTDGMVAWWNFDDNNFADSIGIYDGEEQGTLPIQFVAGKTGFGNAISMDGEDQEILIVGGEPDDLAFAGSTMSVAGWFRVAAFDTSWQALIAKGEGTNWRVHRRGDTGNLTSSLGLGEPGQGGPDVSDGEWHHFVATSDPADLMNLYIDGELAEQTTAAPTITANGQRVMIGENPDAQGREWEGELDDLAIWDRVLTPGEVTELWNNGDGLPIADLFGGTDPATIVTQPQSVTIDELGTAMFSLEPGGSPPFTYQWTKNGSSLVDGPGVSGATTRNLTLTDVPVSDDGAQIAVTVTGNAGGPATSDTVTLTVNLDTTPPAPVSASGSSDFAAMTIVYSERVTDTALTVGNYAVSPSLTLSDPVRIDEFTVKFVTSAQTEDTDYTVTIDGVEDLIGNPTQGATISFTSFTFLPGFASWERWENWTGSLDELIQGHADGTLGPPDISWATTLFESGRGLGDNYGGRGVALLTPETSGDYRFIVTADDNARVFLSTDADPANKLIICGESSWSDERMWADATEEQDSETSTLATWVTFEVSLEAGQSYYLEAFWDEGGGGDGLELTWTAYVGNGDGKPANGTVSALSGDLINAYVDTTGASVTIDQQPQDTDGVEGRTATFRVTATTSTVYGALAAQYQWQMAPAGSDVFTDIPGETLNYYTTPALTAADDGNQYQVVASVLNVSETSAVATLTLIEDSVPPTVVSAGAFDGATYVGVGFSEGLDPTSAQNTANYMVNGAAPTAAELFGAEDSVVRLTVAAAPAAGFTVDVTGVTDVVGNPIADVTVTGAISDKIAVDLIRAGAPGAVTDPILPGNAFCYGEGNYYVAGGGGDVWNTSDGCQYVYTMWTGSFDMRARVRSLEGTHQWAKAMLMCREGIEDPVTFLANNRHADAAATRSNAGGANGQNQLTWQWRDTTGGESGSLDGALRINLAENAEYPDTWIRLVREDATANVFKAYWSNDGTVWNLLSERELPVAAPDEGPIPETVYLGIAVTSHDNSATVPLAEAVVEGLTITEFVPEVEGPVITDVTRTGTSVTVTWTGGGEAEVTDDLNGTWQATGDTDGSYTADIQPGNAFLRIRRDD